MHSRKNARLQSQNCTKNYNKKTWSYGIKTKTTLTTKNIFIKKEIINLKKTTKFTIKKQQFRSMTVENA